MPVPSPYVSTPYPGAKHPGSNSDWGITDWKDELLPGSSRTPIYLAPGEAVPAGYAGDRDSLANGAPFARNDWVMGPNGVPVISGSSEAQPGAAPGGGGGGSSAAAALAAKSKAAMASFGTTLQTTLRNYLQGVGNDDSVFNALAALKSVGQLHPDLNYSFSTALAGDQLNPEQLRRLQELAARLSVQRQLLPSNIA